MSVVCPSCKKLVSVVKTEKCGNVTVRTYSCGDSEIDIVAEMRTILGTKVKDQKGNVLVQSKIEKHVEKRITRNPSKAMQLVFKEGKIVHIHCKASDCDNDWKLKDSNDWSDKFDVEQNQQGIWTINCRKCGRTYLSG